MKYIEPSNSALFPERNGSYAAGNPVTGIAGSIVPSKAVEHPMREIENILKAAGITPSESDLTQLEQSMRIFTTCAMWPDPSASDLVYVSAQKFTTTTAGAFMVDDRILINREIIALVTGVGETSPYEITVIYGTVPEEINTILNQRNYVAQGGNYISSALATEANLVLVASGVGSWAAKTLAQIKTWLGLGSAAYTGSDAYAPAEHAGATGTAHGVATDSAAGFMSAEDKTKLDGLSEITSVSLGVIIALS